MWSEAKVCVTNDQESTHRFGVSTYGDKEQELKNEGLKCQHMFLKSQHIKLVTSNNAEGVDT